MSSRAAQARRGRVRQLFLLALIGAAVFVFARATLPHLVRIRGDATAPVVSSGDWVVARATRSALRHGDVVLIAPPILDGTGPGRLLSRLSALTGGRIGTARPLDERTLRIVAGLPGDRVTFSDVLVTVATSDGSVHSWNRAPLGIVARDPTLRSLIVPDGRLFLVATTAGYADSRETGVVPLASARARVVSILWPADRRASLRP